MRTLILLSTTAALLAVPARADQIDREKLRRAACMPLPFRSLTVEYYADPEQGPRLMAEFSGHFRSDGSRWLSGEKSDIPAETARIEQVLKDHPNDAGAWHQLGKLRRKQGQEESARLAYTKAVALYRQQAKVEPANGRPLAGLGKSLRALGRDREAEAALRQGVQQAPKGWACWLALGTHLHVQGRRVLGLLPDGLDTDLHMSFEVRMHPTGAGYITKRDTDLHVSLEGFSMPKFARKNAERADKLLAEAWQCVEKAVACIPREPRVLAVRAADRAYLSQLRFAIDEACGKKTLTDFSSVSAEELADLRKIADVSPADPHAQAVAILREKLHHSSVWMHQQLNAGAEPSSPPALPDEALKRLDLGFKRLHTAAAGAGESAAVACICLGVLRPFLYLEDAEALAREAVRRAPKEDFCWDLLLHSAAITRDLSDKAIISSGTACVSICKHRVKHNDSACNRYLLAYYAAALEQYKASKKQLRAEKLAWSEEQLRRALQQEPDNSLALLGLAALLLRHSEDLGALKEAGEHLDRAEKALKDVHYWPSNDYRLLRGIHLGLTGNVASARRWLAAIQSDDPQNEQARRR